MTSVDLRPVALMRRGVSPECRIPPIRLWLCSTNDSAWRCGHEKKGGPGKEGIRPVRYGTCRPEYPMMLSLRGIPFEQEDAI